MPATNLILLDNEEDQELIPAEHNGPGEIKLPHGSNIDKELINIDLILLLLQMKLSEKVNQFLKLLILLQYCFLWDFCKFCAQRYCDCTYDNGKIQRLIFLDPPSGLPSPYFCLTNANKASSPPAIASTCRYKYRLNNHKQTNKPTNWPLYIYRHSVYNYNPWLPTRLEFIIDLHVNCIYTRLSLIQSPLGQCSLAGIAMWLYFRE